MSRTITALFDSRTDAEAARSRLTAANIDAGNVRIVDQDEAGSMGGYGAYGSDTTSSSTSTSTDTTGSGHGFWASLKDAFVPHEDRHTYNEGIRRGGVMLYASVDDDDVDRAIDLLEQTGSVNLEEREQSWRSEGWAGYSPSTAGATGADYAASTGTTGTATTGTAANEERIQLAEEQLVVGKREVNRGGARIRSYVVEQPVTEQVRLREEHVNVERRPVDGTTNTGNLDNSALFQERTIEMTETAEEAVVAKQARVTEEIVVSKTAEERTETVSDTVRKTEVEIDNDVAGSSRTTGGSALGGSTDRDRF